MQALQDYDARHEDSRVNEDVAPREGDSGAGAAVAFDKDKDNIDTSPRSSSSHPPDPAPQSRLADWRTRTLHPRNPRPLRPPRSFIVILRY